MFGAQQPAAGGAFGAQPAAGGGLFGAPQGSPGGLFGGGAQQGATGTRVMPYQKTVEKDGTGATGQPTQANFLSITAMPAYQQKSVEELRWVIGMKHVWGGGGPFHACTSNAVCS